MLIQIHMLQNYAPSNLNRDDTGSPKDAVVGGVRRGRISSQCIKRSIRRSSVFTESFGATGLLGMRTKTLPGLIQKELEELGASEEETKDIVKRIPEFGRESKKQKESDEETEENTQTQDLEPETKQLIFIGHNEIRPIAEKLLALYRSMEARKWEKAKIQDIIKELGGSVPRSVDIAMFGRMTTSAAFEDVQAAVQVAHAISTNAITQEFDYYTAVDDLSGETGAGMIGDIEFNSSTYYKYFNIHWEQLLKNLGGDVAVARQAVLALVEAAAIAQPGGKQNSFAAFNLPEFVLIEVSTRNVPVSYSNAFLKPARARNDQSLVDVSIQQLADYMERVIKTYSLESNRASINLSNLDLPGVNQRSSLRDLQEWLSGELPSQEV